MSWSKLSFLQWKNARALNQDNVTSPRVFIPKWCLRLQPAEKQVVCDSAAASDTVSPCVSERTRAALILLSQLAKPSLERSHSRTRHGGGGFAVFLTSWVSVPAMSLVHLTLGANRPPTLSLWTGLPRPCPDDRGPKTTFCSSSSRGVEHHRAHDDLDKSRQLWMRSSLSSMMKPRRSCDLMLWHFTVIANRTKRL